MRRIDCRSQTRWRYRKADDAAGTPAAARRTPPGDRCRPGDLAGKVWRIGLMGYSSRIENITRCLAALDGVLADMGAPVNHGTVLPAAEKILNA